jgi:hypothetical protein
MTLAWVAVLQFGAVAAAGAQQAAQPGAAKPGVVVEQVENGFLAGPDVKYTDINGHDGLLVGALAGVLVDRTLFLGGAGYWLANGDWDRGLSYGGVLVQWHFFGRRSVNVTVGGLIGGGWGTAAYAWDGEARPGPHPSPPHWNGRPGVGPPVYPPTPGYGVYDAGFFVAEPQVALVWRAAEWISISAGVGYRGIAGAGDLDKELRGVTGSLAIRFGSSGR